MLGFLLCRIMAELADMQSFLLKCELICEILALFCEIWLHFEPICKVWLKFEPICNVWLNFEPICEIFGFLLQNLA